METTTMKGLKWPVVLIFSFSGHCYLFWNSKKEKEKFFLLVETIQPFSVQDSLGFECPECTAQSWNSLVFFIFVSASQFLKVKGGTFESRGGIINRYFNILKKK
jgi:hypothetical protein